MADSNAPEHTDRGLFGMFGGKKEEKSDQHVQQQQQQQSYGVDPHATHAPAYTGEGHHAQAPAAYNQPQQYGQGAGGNAYGGTGEVYRAPTSAVSHQSQQYGKGEGGNTYGGEGHHALPPDVSDQIQHYGEGEGGKKQHEGKLHRSNSSSSSSSGEDEDGEEGGRKGRKKKGLREKRSGYQGETEAEMKGSGYQGETEMKEDPEKKSMMEKIKAKIPGHKEGEKRY